MSFKERLETLSNDELNRSIEKTEKDIDKMIEEIADMEYQVLLSQHSIKLINDEKQKRANANRKLFKVVK